ncbi:MAG: SRPBCC family protein [Bacteroidota bacterium]
MKYTIEVSINLARSRVVELFDSVENMYKWQPGLKSFELISGQSGQEGARSKLIYEGRRGDLLMTETITKRDLPDAFHGVYETRGVYNEMYNYFEEKTKDMTIWRSESIFKFKGLMALMAPFMKSAFTNNTLLNMERFKAFAEHPESEQ